tara:strand:+ start:345 stop:947 length:603 start_codon:yes stop_codon:yes gene_type:complete
MTVISNGTNLINNGALDSAVASGKMTLLSTQTASNASTISFATGINSTYDIYIFKFINIHPATNGANFQFNLRDGGSSYDAPKTTTSFRPFHYESDSTPELAYQGGSDIDNSTAVQKIAENLGNNNDDNTSGDMSLYFPSSTASVKHFICNMNLNHSADYPASVQWKISGFANTTTAIDGAQFSMSTGNFDGIIKLYGVA